MVNYVSVCIFLPIIVVTFHLYWRGAAFNQSQPPPRTCCCNTSLLLAKLFDAVVAWFRGPFADLVLHRTLRWLILGAYILLSFVFVGFAAQLKPDEDQVQVWPRGTNWHEMRKIRVDHFDESGSGSNVVRVYMVWGLLEQDRSSCHFTDAKCKGRTRFDHRFNLNNAQCQRGLLSICNKLKDLDKMEADEMRIRRSIATGQLEVACFMESVDKFLKDDAERGVAIKKYPEGTRLGVPIDSAMVKAIMLANPALYNASLLTSDYTGFFEVALGYWLSDGGQGPGYNAAQYGDWMGGSIDSTSHAPAADQQTLAQGYHHGNTLRYAALVINLTLTGATMRHNEGVAVLNKWETFLNSERASLPVDCQQAFQCTPEWNIWHWLKVQEVLLHGAIQGILIGLGVALPVLVFTTLNWIIGLLATLTIALITLAVVGLIPMFGWRLGVMESLNLTLVVGLAVDYAVHLADGYVRSRHYRREERVRDMLAHVGVSIVAGASTTLGASAFMLGAKILFFLQFGLFMFCTIAMSILYALGFFTVVVGIIGPQGDHGSIRWRGCLNDDQAQLQTVLPDTMADDTAFDNTKSTATPR